MLLLALTLSLIPPSSSVRVKGATENGLFFEASTKMFENLNAQGEFESALLARKKEGQEAQAEAEAHHFESVVSHLSGKCLTGESHWWRRFRGASFFLLHASWLSIFNPSLDIAPHYENKAAEIFGRNSGDTLYFKFESLEHKLLQTAWHFGNVISHDHFEPSTELQDLHDVIVPLVIEITTRHSLSWVKEMSVTESTHGAQNLLPSINTQIRRKEVEWRVKWMFLEIYLTASEYRHERYASTLDLKCAEMLKEVLEACKTSSWGEFGQKRLVELRKKQKKIFPEIELPPFQALTRRCLVEEAIDLSETAIKFSSSSERIAIRAFSSRSDDLEFQRFVIAWKVTRQVKTFKELNHMEGALAIAVVLLKVAELDSRDFREALFIALKLIAAADTRKPVETVQWMTEMSSPGVRHRSDSLIGPNFMPALQSMPTRLRFSEKESALFPALLLEAAQEVGRREEAEKARTASKNRWIPFAGLLPQCAACVEPDTELNIEHMRG